MTATSLASLSLSPSTSGPCKQRRKRGSLWTCTLRRWLISDSHFARISLSPCTSGPCKQWRKRGSLWTCTLRRWLISDSHFARISLSFSIYQWPMQAAAKGLRVRVKFSLGVRVSGMILDSPGVMEKNESLNAGS